MIKIVVLIVSIAALVFLMRQKFRPDQKQSVKAIDTTNMVKDPVCETYVEEDTPHKLKYYDKVYSFCSGECMAKFKRQIQSETRQNEAEHKI